MQQWIGNTGKLVLVRARQNHVNIDLFHTLLTGFADDPAPGVHEWHMLPGL